MKEILRLTILLVPFLISLAASAEPGPVPAVAKPEVSVRDYGAAGDGATLDTAGINRAIEACSKTGGGVVRFPPGRYLSGTVRLLSHIVLRLDAGARLVGTTNLSAYEQPAVPSFMPEARWGKWHRALLLAENAEDVTICGDGVIDGNRVFDPTGEERMRGPHTLVFVNCRGFVIRDVSFLDSANYAVFFQASDDVEIRNVKFTGGWDGVHFRGAPSRWCRNVSITGCDFFTGDDSIAGRYWDHVVITRCTINSSCNGIRLIGPATRLLINDCLFYGPGVRPHRSSGRTNMLSGIILQPGAWDRTEGVLDDVVIARNTMHKVASPVTLWTKPGNPVGRVTISGLEATGVYRSAISVESWAEPPVTNVVIRNVHAEFAGGGTEAQGRNQVKGPGVDARPLPAWGVYARNVGALTMEDVRLSLATNDYSPVLVAENVGTLDLKSVRFSRSPGVTNFLVTTNVADIRLRHTDFDGASDGPAR
jgi:hypothetical protein